SMGRPLREGDRVAYCYFYPCGRCYVCLHGQRAACPHKIGRATGPGEFPHWVGAFAEYYYVRPGGFVFRVPDELPDALVSPVNCALSQVIFGFTRAGLAFGESVVIQGAGGLGIQAVAVAREMGAGTVIVIDQQAARLDLARAFGANHALSLAELPDRRARVKQVRDWTGGRGADLACDFAGFPPVVPEGVEMLRHGGRYLEIGCISPGRPVEFEPASPVWGPTAHVGGGMYGPWGIPPARSFLRRCRSRYPFDRLVSHTYPLERIDEAFRDAEWYNREAASSGITRAALAP